MCVFKKNLFFVSVFSPLPFKWGEEERTCESCEAFVSHYVLERVVLTSHQFPLDSAKCGSFLAVVWLLVLQSDVFFHVCTVVWRLETCCF